jgi:pyridoxal phosphate enzyme (YggS family)
VAPADSDGADPAPTPASIAARVADVRRRVRAAGGDPAGVTLVAVTKGFPAAVLDATLAAGVVDVGENYAQEALDKLAALDLDADALAGRGARLHFIGGLQRNKVRQLAPVVGLWQTVDRAELGAEIARRAPDAAVLVQVNASGEPTKGGCAPTATAGLVDQLRAVGLDVRGLMTIGVAGDPDATARCFAAVAALADDLDLPVRSMGMSADLELAVAAGATMVRVGRDLFGPRPSRPGRMPHEQEKRVQ